MKFCTLLICCVLMGRNGMGQQNGTKTQTLGQAKQENNNQRSVDNRNVPTIQAFSSELYEEVKKSQPQNFVLSPLSLTNALVMVGLGAKGETAQEILKYFESKNNTNLIKGQSNLISSLKEISSRNSGVKFVSADKIYAKFGLTIKKMYEEDVTGLGGEIETVDFGNGEEAAGKINGWVHNKTEGKIEKLVEASALTGQTSLLVLSSIYFKGSWENSFNESKTKKIPFFINASCSVNVEMMTQTNEFQLADLEEAKAQVILLPYQGDRLSMMIYLPNGKEETSLDSLENWLADKSPFDIQEKRLNNSFIGDVSVSLPKFKIRSSLKLNEPLKNLGLKKMFDETTADLSGIFEGSGRFFVSQVSQETVIEVNEEGTEAAAVTGFEVAATSFHQTPEFTANRPFLFQIVDSQTKTVLFTGRVKNPLDSGESRVSAAGTEEPSCTKPQQVESTTMKTEVSNNIDTAQTGSNCSCEGNQKSDVESPSSSSPNSTGSPKIATSTDEDLTCRVSALEKLMEEMQNAERGNWCQNLKEAMENLTSMVETLHSQRQQRQRQQHDKEDKEEDENPAKTSTEPSAQLTSTTPESGRQTRSKTKEKKKEEALQRNLSRKSFPPSAASGFYPITGPKRGARWDWNYDETKDATCFTFAEPVDSGKVNRSSCVVFYDAKNCTKEIFRMDNAKSSAVGEIQIPFKIIEASKSIGVCS